MLVYRTRVYMKRCRKLFMAADLRNAEEEIIADPSAWPVIAGSGGIRKARASRDRLGKRGGARMIYFWLDRHREIYFLAAYAKNQQDDLAVDEIRQWKKFVTDIREEKDRAHSKR